MRIEQRLERRMWTRHGDAHHAALAERPIGGGQHTILRVGFGLCADGTKRIGIGEPERPIADALPLPVTDALTGTLKPEADGVALVQPVGVFLWSLATAVSGVPGCPFGVIRLRFDQMDISFGQCVAPVRGAA